MANNPSQRTLAFLRDWGLDPWPVERFNAFSGRRTDLYNIIDYLAITRHSTIGIQSCGTDFSGHVIKLTEHEVESTINWLSNKSRRLILIGWRKVLFKRGMKRVVYRPRIAWLYLQESSKELILEEKDTSQYRGLK